MARKTAHIAARRRFVPRAAMRLHALCRGWLQYAVYNRRLLHLITVPAKQFRVRAMPQAKQRSPQIRLAEPAIFGIQFFNRLRQAPSLVRKICLAKTDFSPYA